MVHADNKKFLPSRMVKRAAGPLALAILYTLSSGLWSGCIWAQRDRTESNSSVRQEAQRNRPEPSVSTPIVFPVTNPSSALGMALASCETGVEDSGLSLPSAKGEVKLDRCYRGREHLICQFNALQEEAKSLLENSQKIVDSNYLEVPDLEGICTIKADTLTSDFQTAVEFADRFKALKAEYEARANCTDRLEQSIRKATLTDMTQAESLLKSMIETIQGDVKGMSELKGKLSERAAKMDASQRAVIVLQKIHRAMCMGHQRTEAKGTPSQ
jgi:hypothetical protein